MTPRSLQPAGLLLLLFCWIFLSTAPAAAADILKIETETTVEVSGDRIRATVAFANRGTAPAYNLQVHLNALGLTDASPVAAQLDPGRSERVFFDGEFKEVGKGRYPMRLMNAREESLTARL